MKVPHRRTAVLISVALAIMTGGVVVTAVASAATTGCRVDYKVTNQWPGGFGGDVTITNLGDALTGWTLTWAVEPGQGITQAWNASVAVTGTTATASNLNYNGAIAANGTMNFGFNGTWTGANPVPGAFSLNGTPCTGTPNATPCAPPSTSPPASSVPPTRPVSTTPSTTESTTPSTTPSRTPSTTPSAPQKKITIWMAGDSTMQNSTACPVGWGGPQFAPLFNSNVTVVNSAIGGRSIQTWLYDPNVTATMNPAGECVISPATYSSRWLAMLNANTGMKAGDYLFIQFGINDGSRTCNRHVGSARYQELLGVMVKAAKDRGANPVLLTPVSAIRCEGNVAVATRGFLTETFAAGAANNVPVIDLHRLSYTLYNTLRLCPNNADYTTGAVGAFFCNDHTHFDAAGARQIAAVVATAVRNQRIPLAAYLR
ncbi:MAG TPA: cellulose binding domain-containing protein [Micromonosporaceae bacterium]|nr:cellulose binding domain-containing protein [Micromonosporaceae bacterium]